MVVDVSAVAKAKQGDKDSFAALYTQVSRDLYRVALYTLGNAQDAQDAVSEAFLEAFKGISKLRDDNCFAPWIMRILSACCKRRIKQLIRDRNNFNIDDFLDLQEQGPALDVRASEKITVLREVEALSAAERQTIALCIDQGYTVREAAELLGEPQGTVSARLHRAVKKLRLRLEE